MAKRPRVFYGWIVLACATTIIAISSGTRFSFGVILKPLAEQFGWDRAAPLDRRYPAATPSPGLTIMARYDALTLSADEDL